MNYRQIAWDWNGTLLNDAEVSCMAISEMLEKRGLGSVSLDEYREKIAFPAINMYYDSGFDLQKESYEDIANEFTGNYLKRFEKIELQKDAAAVLDKFRQRGTRQHIVSASSRDILIRQIEKYGLKPFFTHIFGQRNNYAESKVHLAQKLGKLTGCSPDEILFIGDTVHDYEVAKEAGFHCLLVSNGHCSRERLGATGAPVFPDLTALYDALYP